MFLDQVHRKFHRIGLGLGVELVEKALRLAQFVGVAKNHQNQSLLVRGDADQMLTAMHDELAHGDLLALCQRIAEDDIAFVRVITIRQKIVGFLEIAKVDLVPINEPCHVDGVLGFEL